MGPIGSVDVYWIQTKQTDRQSISRSTVHYYLSIYFDSLPPRMYIVHRDLLIPPTLQPLIGNIWARDKYPLFFLFSSHYLPRQLSFLDNYPFFLTLPSLVIILSSFTIHSLTLILSSSNSLFLLLFYFIDDYASFLLSLPCFLQDFETIIRKQDAIITKLQGEVINLSH